MTRACPDPDVSDQEWEDFKDDHRLDIDRQEDELEDDEEEDEEEGEGDL